MQNKTHVEKVRTGVKASGVILPLLGITWLFGLLSFNSDTIIFKYIFTIFNSLQGLMIFIFHCVLNKQVTQGFVFLFAFIYVLFTVFVLFCCFSVLAFFLLNLARLINTFCCDNKRDTSSVQFILIFLSGSFAVNYGDHLWSRIICGPFWGSFSVWQLLMLGIICGTIHTINSYSGS